MSTFRYTEAEVFLDGTSIGVATDVTISSVLEAVRSMPPPPVSYSGSGTFLLGRRAYAELLKALRPKTAMYAAGRRQKKPRGRRAKDRSREAWVRMLRDLEAKNRFAAEGLFGPMRAGIPVMVCSAVEGARWILAGELVAFSTRIGNG